MAQGLPRGFRLKTYPHAYTPAGRAVIRWRATGLGGERWALRHKTDNICERARMRT